MADLFQSLAETVVRTGFERLLSDERKYEIARIGKSWDYYYGEQEKYIRQYRGEKDEDYIDKDKPTFNYTQAIVDEYVRGVFAKPVVVTLKETKDQKRWQNIIEPLTFFNIVPFLKKAQRVAEVSDTCFVMLRYDPVAATTYFEDIRGEYMMFLPDDNQPKTVGTVVINYLYDTGASEQGMRVMRRVEIWNRERWAIYLYSPVLKDLKLVDSGDNPYGFIPGVRLQPAEDDNTFYGITPVHDIVKINEIYNNLWTSTARITVMQSFSILVVTTDGTIEMIVAPTRFIKFEGSEKGNSDAKYITPEPKIEEVRKVLIDLKSELQNFSHVPSEIIAQTGGVQFPQSGYALRIRRVPIENVWEDRRMSYGPALRNLIQMAIKVDAVNKGESDGRPFHEIETDIRFTETVPGLDPQEQAIKDEQELKYGVISPVDLMIRKHPELTRDQAKEKVKKNREETQELGMAGFGSDDSPFKEVEDLKARANVTRQGIEQRARAEAKEGADDKA